VFVQSMNKVHVCSLQFSAGKLLMYKHICSSYRVEFDGGYLRSK